MSTPTVEPAAPAHVIATAAAEGVYDDGYLRVEHENYYVSCGGQPIYLARVEFLLLSRLSRTINRVVKSDDLWRAAWADTKPLNCGSLHVYIHRLRNKLSPYKVQIDTVVNVGYRLLAPSDNPN